jgi:hypothetical protein
MRRLAAASLVGALAVAGCGSSSLSAGDLRDRATGICDLARKRTDRIPTPAAPAGGAAFLRRGIAALAPELAGLGELRPPGDLAGDWTRAVTDAAGELRALREAENSLQRGTDPVTTMRGLQRHLAPLEAQGDSAWLLLRIPACAAE